jgi:hypothetical protein
MIKKKLFSIVLLVLAALVLALAPAAQAEPVEPVEFVGDASALLNLEGRAVLAAVNFWDPSREDNGQRTVGVIQGVDFDDFDCTADDTGSPIALSAGVAGATLSTVIDQSSGREFADKFVYDTTQIGTFSPQSLDNIEAERLAQGGGSHQNGNDLSFAFGAGWANTAVQVQMLGGGVWGNDNPTSDGYFTSGATLTAWVDGVDLGYVKDMGYNFQLSTFEATTDGSGNLLIEMASTTEKPNLKSNVLAGITVTAEPLPPFLPEDGDQAVNPIDTELSWILPDPNAETTLWFDGSDTKIYNSLPNKTSWLVDQDLDQNTEYTWRVMFTDPNNDDAVISDTNLTFKTLLTNQAPTVAVADFYTWLEEDGTQTIEIDTAVITDTDGTGLHTYTWSVADASPTPDATFEPDGPDTTHVTDVTFNAAGVYVLQLEVNDNGDYNIPGTVTVTVYEDGCVAAKAVNAYDEAAALLARDANYDCQVNLADFAALAAAWMNSNVQ